MKKEGKVMKTIASFFDAVIGMMMGWLRDMTVMGFWVLALSLMIFSGIVCIGKIPAEAQEAEQKQVTVVEKAPEPCPAGFEDVSFIEDPYGVYAPQMGRYIYVWDYSNPMNQTRMQAAGKAMKGESFEEVCGCQYGEQIMFWLNGAWERFFVPIEWTVPDYEAFQKKAAAAWKDNQQEFIPGWPKELALGIEDENLGIWMLGENERWFNHQLFYNDRYDDLRFTLGFYAKYSFKVAGTRVLRFAALGMKYKTRSSFLNGTELGYVDMLTMIRSRVGRKVLGVMAKVLEKPEKVRLLRQQSLFFEEFNPLTSNTLRYLRDVFGKEKLETEIQTAYCAAKTFDPNKIKAGAEYSKAIKLFGYWPAWLARRTNGLNDLGAYEPKKNWKEISKELELLFEKFITHAGLGLQKCP